MPGHFHATVVIGTTLTFMALTYFLIPVLFRREMISPGLAKIQPYPLRLLDVLLLPGDDGRRYAGRFPSALGHGLQWRGPGL